MNLYEESELSFNVHCLIHMTADVKEHGTIDACTAFAFESNMCHVKKDIQKHERSLQQLLNKTIKRMQLPGGIQVEPKVIELTQAQNSGQLPPQCRLPGYCMAKYKEFILAMSAGDNCIMMTGYIVVAQAFAHLKASSKVCSSGEEFHHKEDFCTISFELSRIEIFVVSGLSITSVY